MKTLFVLLALVCAPMSSMAHEDHDSKAVHLKFEGGAYHLHANWLVGPTTNGESVMRFEWKSGRDHSPIEAPGNFDVILWMPDMNHGSSPTQITRVLDGNDELVLGSYDVSSIYFVMGGKWEVRVVVDRAGKSESKSFFVNLEGDHHH